MSEAAPAEAPVVETPTEPEAPVIDLGPDAPPPVSQEEPKETPKTEPKVEAKKDEPPAPVAPAAPRPVLEIAKAYAADKNSITVEEYQILDKESKDWRKQQDDEAERLKVVEAALPALPKALMTDVDTILEEAGIELPPPVRRNLENALEKQTTSLKDSLAPHYEGPLVRDLVDHAISRGVNVSGARDIFDIVDRALLTGRNSAGAPVDEAAISKRIDDAVEAYKQTQRDAGMKLTDDGSGPGPSDGSPSASLTPSTYAEKLKTGAPPAPAEIDAMTRQYLNT